MAGKLHATIAVESEIKNRAERFLTEAYKDLQKPPLFDGLIKTYEATTVDGDEQEPKRQLVQLRVDQLLQDIAEQMSQYIDTVATKDFGNCQAKADVVVDGEVILKDVPVTHLLFLEKKVKDLSTAINTLPVLDAAYDWTKDEALGLFKSTAVKTTATKKVQEALTLYDATKEHPAQTQLIQVEKPIGTWTTVRQSGAVTTDRKRQLQQRVQKLSEAVKRARSQANDQEVEQQHLGAKLFGYLLAE